MRTFARIRPDTCDINSDLPRVSYKILTDSRGQGETLELVTAQEHGHVVGSRGTMRYKFSRVLPEDTTEEELFQAAAKDAVFACLRGVSATILFLQWGYYDDARMVTGSKDGSGQTWAVSVIRSLFGEMGKTGSRACLEHQKIRVSSVKVVGDRVYDLLGAIEADGRPETRAEGLWVDGTNCGNGATSRAQAIGVSNEEETLSALHRVNSRQFAGKAALPRGHTVFSISIPFEGTSTITDQAGAAPLETITRCELNLVHLANGEGAHECDDPGRLPGVPGGGSSPRSGETRAGVADATEASPRTPGTPVSVHAREGGNVDRSLGALERVLGTLQHPGSAIPYRDSPLTLVLRDSLSVGSQVALAVDLSLRVRHLPETVSMFRFIERCSGVQQVGVTGEDLAAVEQMTLLREENAGMRASLQAYEAILQDLTRQIEDQDKGTKKTAGRLEATDTTGASKELSHVGEEAFAALTKALVNGSDEASEKLETLDRRSLQKCCRELCTLAQRPGHSSPSSAGSREEAEGEDAEGGDDVEDLVFFRALPTPSPAGHSVGRAARGAPCSGGIGRDEQRDSCGRESQDHGQLSSTGEVELGYGTCGSDAITPRAEGVAPRPRTANVQAGRLAERRLSSGLTKKGKSVRAFGNVAMSPMRKSTFLLEQESSELKRASILPAKGSRRQQHVHDNMGSHGDIIFDAVTPATDTLTASFLSPFGSESTAGAILLSDDEKEDDQESDGDEATVGSTMRRGAGEGYSGQQSLQGEEGMPSEQTARRPPPLLSIVNDESDFDTVGKGRRCKSVASATSEDRLCALLTEGGFFIKHSKFGKPHVRFVWMSWDLSRIMWRRCGKEAVRKSARTTSFDAVYVGATERDPAASGVTSSATSTMSRGLFLPTRPRTSGNAEKQIVLSGANGRQQLVLEVDGGRLPPEKEIEQRDQWLQAFRFAVQRANRDVASKMVRTQEYRRSKSANNLESKDGEGLTPTLSASGRTSLPFEASLKLKHDLDVSHSSSGGSLGWGDVASMSGSETISPSPGVNSRGGSGAFATSGSKTMIRPLPSAMKSIKDERDSEHRISSKTATVSPPSTSTKRVSWGMQDLISPSSGPLSALTSPGDPQSQRGHAASPPPSLLSSSSASEAHLSPSSHDGSDVPLHAAGDPEQRRVRRSNTPRRPRQGVFNFQSKPGAQMDTSHHEPGLEFFPIPSEDDSASEQGTKDDVPAAGGEDDQEAVNSVAHADGSTTSASALPADENSSDSSLMHLSSRSPCDGDGKEGSSHRLASQTNPRRWWNLTPRVKTAAGRSSSGNFGSAGSPVGSSGDTVQQLQPSSPSRLGRAASARDAQSSCSSDGPTEGSERDVAQPPSSQGSPTSSDSRGSSSSSAATHVMG